MTSPIPRSLAAALACVCIAIVSACTSESVGPRTGPGVTRVVTKRSAVRGGTPNAIKYRDKGLRPATASSGAATLQMRALVGKGGDALIEASTGNVESGAGPGSIDKVQVKLPGDEIATLNFQSSGGYWSTTIPGLARGDEIQLKANISGIAGSQTEIVTLTGAVALRPDLEVVSVAAPNRVFTHNPVMLVAALRERNGDVGARANCVLSVDGAAVDQATGIWVDAGDVVSCMFMHTFDAPGNHTVSISAASVAPADWDTANNAVSRTVVVADPGTPILNGYMEFWEQHAHERYEAVRGGDNPRNFVVNSDHNFSQLFFTGETKDLAPGPFSRVEARLFRNGQAFHESTLTEIQNTRTENELYIADCGFFQSAGESVSYCTAVPAPGNPNFFFNSVYIYVRLAGSITYLAHDEFCELYGDCNIYNYNDAIVWDPPTAFDLQPGDQLRVELEYVDANSLGHVVNETLPLPDAPERANWVFSECFPWADGLGDACVTNTSTGRAVFGSKEWGPEPPFHF